MTEYEGNLSGAGLRIAIVVSRFNRFIGDRLLGGALDGLRRHGVLETDIDTVWVPGSFELPLAAQKLSKSHDAVICLGAIIRGDTAHFDLVAGETAAGIAAVARETGVPIVFGVLTTDTMEQAIDRAGGKSGNKGYEAALTAIEMVNLLHSLPGK